MPDPAASTATGSLSTAVDSFSTSVEPPFVALLPELFADVPVGVLAAVAADAALGSDAATAAPPDKELWDPEFPPPPPPHAPSPARAKAVASAREALNALGKVMGKLPEG
jgi:hypothetical protein